MYTTEFEIIEDVLTDSENLEYKILKSFPSTSFSIRINLEQSTHPDLSKFINHSKFFNTDQISYCKYDFDFPIIKRIEKLTSFKFIYFTFLFISKNPTTLYLTFDIEKYYTKDNRQHSFPARRNLNFYDDMNFGMNMSY